MIIGGAAGPHVEKKAERSESDGLVKNGVINIGG